MNSRLLILSVGAGVVFATIASHAMRHAATSGRIAAPVTAVVRNDLGQLKWVVTQPVEYTPLEAEGRHLYLQAGCTYCHSQHARPVTGNRA